MSTKEYVYSYYRVGKYIDLCKTSAQHYELRKNEGEKEIPKMVWLTLRFTERVRWAQIGRNK